MDGGPGGLGELNTYDNPDIIGDLQTNCQSRDAWSIGKFAQNTIRQNLIDTLTRSR